MMCLMTTSCYVSKICFTKNWNTDCPACKFEFFYNQIFCNVFLDFKTNFSILLGFLRKTGKPWNKTYKSTSKIIQLTWSDGSTVAHPKVDCIWDTSFWKKNNISLHHGLKTKVLNKHLHHFSAIALIKWCIICVESCVF